MNTLERRLPFHRLTAFSLAKELLAAVLAAEIRDSELRDQAVRAAKSAALNVAEGACRAAPKDKARVFAIARGEAGEAAAAVELASLLGATSPQADQRVYALADRLYAILTGLCR